MERISKILSLHGVSSRREAENMILAGRVTVDGVTAKLGQRAEPHEIAVDGKPLKPQDEFVYIMLNKPRGYVTTMRDNQGRKTVRDLVADIDARVYPAGRLDIDSEGLLIMTNDGQFANAVMHPSYNKAKTYEVRVRGDITRAEESLSLPMEIDSHMIRPASVKLLRRTTNGGVFLITIHEGRNRQIRKMCEKCGLAVEFLKRVSIGELKLGTLKTGQWRHLTETEIEGFLSRVPE